MNCLLIIATSAAVAFATEQTGSAVIIPKSTRAAAARVYAGSDRNNFLRLDELSAANSRLIEELTVPPPKKVVSRNVNAPSCATLICYHIARSWQQYQDAAKAIRGSNGNHQQVSEHFRQEENRFKANIAPYLTAPVAAKKLHDLQLEAATGHERRAAAELGQQRRLMTTMVREMRQYQTDYRRCLKECKKQARINQNNTYNTDLQILEEKLSVSEQALAAESEYITREAAYYYQLYTRSKSGNS